MLGMLTKLATAAALRQRLELVTSRAIHAAVATIAGLFGVGYILDAAWHGLAVSLPLWAASLALGCLMLAIAAAILWVGNQRIKRERVSMASIPATASLAALLPKITGIVSRYPLVMTVAAIAVLVVLSGRRDNKS